MILSVTLDKEHVQLLRKANSWAHTDSEALGVGPPICFHDPPDDSEVPKAPEPLTRPIDTWGGRELGNRLIRCNQSAY